MARPSGALERCPSATDTLWFIYWKGESFRSGESAVGYFLVVEDDPVIRRAIGRAADGVLEARFAEDGGQAAEAFDAPELPTFVLLDYLLPDTNGLEVLRRLRTHPGFATVPVIMFSSLQDPGARERALRAGATDWVTKPDDPKALREAVRDFCRTWGGAATEAASAR